MRARFISPIPIISLKKKFQRIQSINTVFTHGESVGSVIQATGTMEFEDGLRLGSLLQVFVTDTAPALAHWSHLCCKTCVALVEVRIIPVNM